MKPAVSALALTLAATPALAQETRELQAHVHGVGTLNIAVDGSTVAMEFKAPGSDIVGFEYAPATEADKATVAAALETLSAPQTLFTLPESAGCAVTQAAVELEIEGEEDHDDHGHDDHGHDDHGHDDHAEKAHDDHGHEDHAGDDHDDHGHDGDGHDAAEAASHSEFHAEYALICDDPSAIDAMTFAYFDAFPNALEVEVQVITPTGAQAFEVERDSPTLSLDALF